MNNIIAECPAIFNLRGRDGGRDCDYPVAGVTLSQKAGVQALPLIRRGETCPLRPSQATAACEITRPIPVGLAVLLLGNDETCVPTGLLHKHKSSYFGIP